MKHVIVFLRTLVSTSLLMLLGLFVISCDKKQEAHDITKIEAARVAMVEWLECEECEENQLENVLKHSAQLQPMLISTLHKGVAPASRELYKRELERRYDELVAYSKTHPNSKPTLPKEEFVNLYLDNMTAQYQTRAAQALSIIGDEKSKQALQEALDKSKREDVKEAITQALQEINKKWSSE